VDRPVTPRSLGDAARIIARSGDLDSKLDALAAEARTLTGASVVVIYVHDPTAATVVPAAQAGLPAADLGTGAIAVADANDIAAIAVRERRQTRAGPAASRLLAAKAESAVEIVATPLVSVDVGGSTEAEGALLCAFDKPASSETDELLEALADMCAVAIRQARLENALTDRADWLNQLATTDPLTGLANASTFEQMLELELARARRQQFEVSLVLFDIAGLADIDHRAGGQAGDDVLRHVASVIGEEVRVVDTVARLGADEFGVIAPGGGGEVVARRIREAVAARPGPTGEPTRLYSGVAIFPADADTGRDLLNAANQALEAARQDR
jgi:diguanylate cyclase (GGDEF)-like protein